MSVKKAAADVSVKSPQVTKLSDSEANKNMAKGESGGTKPCKETATLPKESFCTETESIKSDKYKTPGESGKLQMNPPKTVKVSAPQQPNAGIKMDWYRATSVKSINWFKKSADANTAAAAAARAKQAQGQELNATELQSIADDEAKKAGV